MNLWLLAIISSKSVDTIINSVIITLYFIFLVLRICEQFYVLRIYD